MTPGESKDPSNMLNPIRRRDFLRQMLTGAAGLSLSGIGTSNLLARQARSPVEATKLADSFYQITGAGRNILALTTGDGILLVNGGLAERRAEVQQSIANQSSAKNIQAV